jgi:hypothetical protein
MSEPKLKPFQACSKFYKLSPETVVEVNDCCFQSCYRYAGTGKPFYDCLQDCTNGQDVLTEVVGKSPCQYGRRFKAPPTHDKCSVFYEYLRGGNTPETATTLCLQDAKSESDKDACLVDSLAFILGSTETMETKPRARASLSAPEPKTWQDHIGVVLGVAVTIGMFYLVYKQVLAK